MTVDFGVGSLQHLGDSRKYKLCESFTFSRLQEDTGSSSLSHQPNCWNIFGTGPDKAWDIIKHWKGTSLLALAGCLLSQKEKKRRELH